MTSVKDKIWFLREGLFAKYVMALVGLVVFVLAVNGATETWISYRATKSTLTDAMAEKAEATAKRIDQSIVELERQISWVTRASVVKLEDRRNDYAQLLNQVPPPENISFHKRELFYVMTPNGLTCVYAELGAGDKIVLIPHPASGNLREEFNRDEVTIIGQVVGVPPPFESVVACRPPEISPSRSWPISS